MWIDKLESMRDILHAEDEKALLEDSNKDPFQRDLDALRKKLRTEVRANLQGRMAQIRKANQRNNKKASAEQVVLGRKMKKALEEAEQSQLTLEAKLDKEQTKLAKKKPTEEQQKAIEQKTKVLDQVKENIQTLKDELSA